MFAILSNIVLSALIVYPWYRSGVVGPHAGLALATALAGYINAGLLFFQLRKQEIYQPQQAFKKVWIKDFMRIAAGLIAMVVVVSLLNPMDSWWQDAGLGNKALTLLGLVAAAIVSYFATLFVFGVRKHTFTM